MPLFDSDFLKRLEYLSLVSRRVFRGQLLAQRRTLQKGSGIEFADHRDYVAGDDYRYLDWNIYARHGELLLKRFQEEEDLHVYIFVDCSRSMQFGTPPKFDYARQVAAALAYIALADLDRVSLIAFGGQTIDTLPLTRGKSRILSLLSFLENLPGDQRETSLDRTAREFVHRNQRSGLAVVVSDFYDPAGFERGIDLIRHHRYEPHLVRVYDPLEADPDQLGDLELVDVETEEIKKVTVTERNLRQYRQAYEEFAARLARYCATYGLGYAATTTDVPFDEFVLGMMRQAGTVQ